MGATAPHRPCAGRTVKGASACMGGLVPAWLCALAGRDGIFAALGLHSGVCFCEPCVDSGRMCLYATLRSPGSRGCEWEFSFPLFLRNTLQPDAVQQASTWSALRNLAVKGTVKSPIALFAGARHRGLLRGCNSMRRWAVEAVRRSFKASMPRSRCGPTISGEVGNGEIAGHALELIWLFSMWTNSLPSLGAAARLAGRRARVPISGVPPS